MTPAGSPAPSEDIDLDAVFQAVIAGITGLPGNMVRPRWQPNPPKQPEPTVNWCALGVSVQSPERGTPYIQHLPDGEGKDRLRRHEDIVVFCSFYGPNSGKNALLFRDGLYIAQNLEAIGAAGVSFIACGDSRAAPELVNQQWIKRHDIAATFRRQVARDYAVLNIEAADITLISDDLGVIGTIHISE